MTFRKLLLLTLYVSSSTLIGSHAFARIKSVAINSFSVEREFDADGKPFLVGDGDAIINFFSTLHVRLKLDMLGVRGTVKKAKLGLGNGNMECTPSTCYFSAFKFDQQGLYGILSGDEDKDGKFELVSKQVRIGMVNEESNFVTLNKQEGRYVFDDDAGTEAILTTFEYR